MTFKIKQKAIKNYDNYRNRQIHKVAEEKAKESVENNVKHLIHVKKNANEERYKTVGDVFGSNWPYEDFSLVEMAKIDIDLEIT